MSYSGTSLQDAIRISEAAYPFRRVPSSGHSAQLSSDALGETALYGDIPTTQAPPAPPRLGDNPDESCSHSVAARTETGHLLNGSLSTQDAMNLLSSRNRPHKVWRKRYAKLLVVGDAGLGKTTLIRTLLSVPGQKIQLHDGAETSIEQFRKNPASMCSQICWRDEEDRVEWYYTVQDTPGYGDKVNIHQNIDIMVDFVIQQNQKWFNIETSKKRPADMSSIEDPRIDICLFCLPPHRLRYVDVRFMYELGKVVPIIPIITKADTMNIREATIYRQEVHSKLQNMSQYGMRGRIGLFEFQKETLGRAGVDPSVSQFQTLPFLIVASNEVNMELSQKGVFWPERQYAWGTCEAFNPDHSDVLHLRLLLLKEGLEEISAAKLERSLHSSPWLRKEILWAIRYEVWRRKRLSKLRFGFNMKLLVLTTTALMAFGIGSSLASGKPARDIVCDVGQALWRRVRRIVHLRGRKKQDAASKPVPQNKKAMFG